jgi:hypothetical protein
MEAAEQVETAQSRRCSWMSRTSHSRRKFANEYLTKTADPTTAHDKPRIASTCASF